MSSIDTTKYICSVFSEFGKGEIDPETGLVSFNCYGMFRGVFSEYGVFLDERNISCDAVEQIHGQIGLAVLQEWERIPEPEEPCAVVFMSTNTNFPTGYVDHLGVYIGGGKILHTQRKTGPLETDVNDRFWRGRIAGFYRYIGKQAGHGSIGA